MKYVCSLKAIPEIMFSLWIFRVHEASWSNVLWDFFSMWFFFLQFVPQRSQRKNWWILGSLIAFSFDILSRVYLQLFDLELKRFIRCKGSCLFDCGVIKLPRPYQGVICHCNFLPLHSRQKQIFAKWWENLHSPVHNWQAAQGGNTALLTTPPSPFLDASHK